MSDESIAFTEGGEKLVISRSEDSDQLGKLYEAYSQLEALGDKAGENKDAFKVILGGTKQSQRCKTLAAGFIARFFKFFDDLQPKALDAYLDLIEEDNTQIRISAIRGITQICEDRPTYVTQMANVLGQLLPDEEVVSNVVESLLSLLDINLVATVDALSQHVANNSDSELRSKVLAFLRKQVAYGPKRDAIASNTEVETLLVDRLKPLLSKVESEDFSHIMAILKRFPRYQSDEGAKEMLNILVESQFGDLKSLNVSDVASVEKFLGLLPLVIQLSRSGADHSQVWETLVQKLLPSFASFEPEVTLRILHAVADLSGLARLDESKAALPRVYSILHDHVPLPVEGEEPEYNFSFLEALLVAFHNLGFKAQGSLNAVCGIKIFTGQPDEDHGDYSDKREDMVKRFSLFLSKTEEYHKRYSEQKAEEPSENASEEEREQYVLEKKQSSMRHRLLSNLKKLTRPLVSSNPQLISASKEVQVSWRAPRKGLGKRRASHAADGERQTKRQKTGTTRGRRGRGGRGNRRSRRN